MSEGFTGMDRDDVDASFEDSMRDAVEDGSSVSEERAQRFYDRIRGNINAYLQKKGSAVGKAGEFLLLVPDVFFLLWRLVNDSRVSGKAKVMLGSGLAYYLFPFDILPEAMLGATGFLDDLVLAAYILNKIVGEADPEVVREHWSGSEDVLAMIARVLNAADSLTGSDFVNRIKKMI